MTSTLARTEHEALVKSTTKIFSNFVAFSENPNFNQVFVEIRTNISTNRNYLSIKKTKSHFLISGGLAKWPENMPDPMHTYLGLAGLSIASYSDLRPIDPELNITKRARASLTRSRS